MKKRLLITLLTLLATSVLAEQQSTDRFWLGVLRSDGVLTPFALYDQGKWLTPWPGALGTRARTASETSRKLNLPSFSRSKDHRLEPKTVPLQQLPVEWFGSSPTIPTEWYLWPASENPQSLKVTRATQYESHCTYNWGLLTNYAPKETADYWPRPKAGIVTSAALNVIPMVTIEIGSREAREVMPVMAPAFRKREADKISKDSRNTQGDYLKYTGHPVSEHERNRSKLSARKILKSREPVDGRWLYYVEGQRSYMKPSGFPDHGCDAITAFSGWLLKKEDRFSMLNVRASITDCDMKEVNTALPNLILAAGGHYYLISENYGYEWEYYTVDRLTGTAITNELSKGGGGC